MEQSIYDEIIDKIPRHEEIKGSDVLRDEQTHLAIQLDIGDRTKSFARAFWRTRCCS